MGLRLLTVRRRHSRCWMSMSLCYRCFATKLPNQRSKQRTLCIFSCPDKLWTMHQNELVSWYCCESILWMLMLTASLSQDATDHHVPTMASCQHPLHVLDGGMGHLLKQRGLRVPGLPLEQQFLAGVLANESQPDAVMAAHTEFINSGATVITSNSFAATRHSLARIGKQADAIKLAEAAGVVARQAAQQSGHRVLVAGSLPPLGECYRPEAVPTQDEAVAEYGELARALLQHVDVFLAETLATSREAIAAAEATAGLGKDLWVSYTLEDSTAALLRGGEPLAQAVAALSCYGHIKAILVNCCSPVSASAALPTLLAAAPEGVQVGAYANGFKSTSRWLAENGGPPAPKLQIEEGDYGPGPDGIITPMAYMKHACTWRQAGATIVGGCCGIGPEHIRLIATIMTDGAST